MKIPNPSALPQASGVYYPYIDGLRALAVLSVVLFHLHGAWLPGGFVGVDVFFVISGFVVSASLAELQGAGFWRLLGQFYVRRVKRIVPALWVCLLFTTLLATAFIPFSWLSVVNQQTGVYAFFGLSNLILAESGRDYFAPTTDYNPYTHTWSLAVEEQFYLIFPLLFFTWLSSARGKLHSVRLFGVGLLLSLLFSAWQSYEMPTSAYFLSPGRFWELAAGVLLYQVMQLQSTQIASCIQLRRWVAWVSLGVLATAFACASTRGFPVPGAIPAVLGALGLLFGLHGQHEPRPLLSGLGHPLVTGIGKISYSLYLWHWPVFVLFRWTWGLESIGLRFLAMLLAFSLAYASWRWVEQPIRRAVWLKRLPAWSVILLGVLSLAGGAWLADRITHNNRLSLSVLSHQPELWYPKGPAAHPDYPGCTAEPEYHDVEGGTLMIYQPRGCIQPRLLRPVSLFVIGDSHAIAYEGLLKQYAITQSVRVYAYNNGGCPFISFQPWRDLDNAACRHYSDAALRDIKNRMRPGDVLFLPSLRMARLSDQWAYFGEASARAQMLSPEADLGRQRSVAWAVPVLKEFAQQGMHILFEAPKPVFFAPPFRCADWFSKHNPICAAGFEVPRLLLASFRAPVLDALQSVARQVPDVSIWDPFPVLCPDAVCRAWPQGQPSLFLDGDHLSGWGNQYLLPYFTERMNQYVEWIDLKSEER